MQISEAKTFKCTSEVPETIIYSWLENLYLSYSRSKWVSADIAFVFKLICLVLPEIHSPLKLFLWLVGSREFPDPIASPWASVPWSLCWKGRNAIRRRSSVLCGCEVNCVRGKFPTENNLGTRKMLGWTQWVAVAYGHNVPAVLELITLYDKLKEIS